MNFTADDIPDVIANGEPDECEFVARWVHAGPAVRQLLAAADRARPIDRTTDDEPNPVDVDWLLDRLENGPADHGCATIPCSDPENCEAYR